MANLISFESFNKIYSEKLKSIYQYWTPEMQEEIARHCYAWSPDMFDFKVYLRASALRYYYAYRSILPSGRDAEICDVGGLWGVFPATLKALGFQVTMTESLQYYSTAFKPLFDHIIRLGIKVVDYDPFKAGETLSQHFDLITVMAVLEHYPHSLKDFMANVVSMMKLDGKIYIEVPNIAYWPKRISLLRGKTPLPDLREIFLSQVPFIGHHHEFTISELRELAKLCGLRIIEERFYNYSQRTSWETIIKSPLQILANLFIQDSRECLAIYCDKVHTRRPD